MSQISPSASATTLEPCAADLDREYSPAPHGPCANVLGIAVEALNMERALVRLAQIPSIRQEGLRVRSWSSWNP